jgi:aerobic carbon-monoxide dehydrogenase large subunit
MGQYAVGQSVPRTEDPRLLRGDGRYFDDVTLRNQAHAAFLRSPHAHARINNIDTAAAKEAPGVIAVLTGEDWKAAGFGHLPSVAPHKRRDGSPLYIPPHPALNAKRVMCVGDPIAVVIAETEAQARDAAELIDVDFEILPSVTDTAKATDPEAPQLWEEAPANECFVRHVGDRDAAEAGFARAARVVKQRFVVTRVTANTMEPRGCIADYDRRRDRYHLYAPQQSPHQLRQALAVDVFRLPETKFHIVTGDIGGAFGMKNGNYAEYAVCLWASKLVERPVKWVAMRSEGLMSDEDGRDNVTDAELALDEDGNFLAMRVRTFAAMGAYLSKAGPNPPIGNIGGLAGVYRTPAIHCEVIGVFTNTQSTAPYRGAGRPEASYVIERLIDIAAQELGRDPVALRRQNMIPPDALPFKTGLTFTYDVGEFETVMDIALKAADYDGFEARRKDSEARGKLRGIGISSTIEQAAGPNVESASVRFDPSGTVTLLVGTTDQGQGHEVAYKQIVGQQLGIDSDDIRVVEGDTDQVSFGRGTFGSRSAALGGTCLLRASEKIIEKGRRIAAHALEAAPEDIEFKDGNFTVAGTDRGLSLKKIAALAHSPGKLPPDMEPGLDEMASFTPAASNFPYGTHVCEVEVDPETGKVAFVKYTVADDVGVQINPLLVKGQIHGGIGQGLGQAMMEHKHFDPDSGQLVTGSFMDYAMPHADDLCMIDIHSHSVPTMTNPLGVKGVGECGCVGALAAVMNAVNNALGPLGIRHVEMPLTPDRVWRAIRGARGRQAA